MITRVRRKMIALASAAVTAVLLTACTTATAEPSPTATTDTPALHRPTAPTGELPAELALL